MFGVDQKQDIVTPLYRMDIDDSSDGPFMYMYTFCKSIFYLFKIGLCQRSFAYVNHFTGLGKE